MPSPSPAQRAAPPRSWRTRLSALLRKTFGLRRLREGQEAVIASVMAGTPTLALMPTGGGKSLCYQLPALLLPGSTVVVSPLIALMKDQCDKLRELGVAAWQLNSALPAAEIEAAEQAIAAGEARIVFTTPERLAEPEFLEKLAEATVSLLVIDEAHCISQWGHDFRPAFLEIGPALARLDRPRLLALTATATEAVSEDIARQLGIGRFTVINTGMYRPNLHYSVMQVTRESDKLERAVELLLLREVDFHRLRFALGARHHGGGCGKKLKEVAGFDIAQNGADARIKRQNGDAFSAQLERQVQTSAGADLFQECNWVAAILIRPQG